MKKSNNKTRSRKSNRSWKNRKWTTERIVYFLIVVFIISILIGPKLNFKQQQRDRQIELSFAYFYCANKIIELDTQGNRVEMDYYYDAAKRIESKLKEVAGIEATKKKMEKVYWANQ